MSIRFACPKCKKQYQVKDALAGKRAKCAACQQSMKVPSPPPSSPASMDLMSDLLDEVDEAKQSGLNLAGKPTKRTRTLASGKSCPSCKSPLAENAVLCVQCGYNLKSGARLSTASIASPKKKAKSHSGGSGGGNTFSLIRGTIFSLIGAMLGAFIWAIVAIFTGYQIGWIAWGVGALAGAGMALGHEDDDGTVAGIIAGTCALAGLLAAKGAIYSIFVAPILLIDTMADVALIQDYSDVEFVRGALTDYLANEEMGGLEAIAEMDEATYERKSMEAQGKAEAIVEGLTDQEAVERVKVQEARMKAEFEEGLEEYKEAVAGGESMSFFSVMFSPIDGLFVLLALGTAFKLASGQPTD